MRKALLALTVVSVANAGEITDKLCEIPRVLSVSAPPFIQVLGIVLLIAFIFLGYKEARQGYYATALGVVVLGIVFLALAFLLAEPIGTGIGQIGAAFGC